MRKMLFTLAMVLSAGQLSAGHHKIQVVLTNPRTVSTALEKSMMARGDHKVFHEPWISSFMFHSAKADVFTQLPPQQILDAKTHDEVKALIYRHAQERPVFLKDMIWGIGQDFLNDDELLSDPDVVLSFLIRDPALSIESFFMKGSERFSSKELALDLTSKVFKYEDLVPIAEKYHAIRGVWPIILEAEDLCSNPTATMKTYCEQIGISYIEGALSWEEGMPEEWKHLASWHIDAAVSKGFFVPRRDELARFTSVEPEYVAALETIYQTQKPHYEKLKKMK